VHYERDWSGFLFTMSFATAIWRGWDRPLETPSSRTQGHRETGGCTASAVRAQPHLAGAPFPIRS
jgi:hypothetical protein